MHEITQHDLLGNSLVLSYLKKNLESLHSILKKPPRLTYQVRFYQLVFVIYKLFNNFIFAEKRSLVKVKISFWVHLKNFVSNFLIQGPACKSSLTSYIDYM